MKKIPHPLRTRFGGDIVTEFLPPAKPSHKVIIICRGMPGLPRFQDLLVALSRAGYWTFFPRYRGSWESGGSFMQKSPHQDVLDVMNGLSRGFSTITLGQSRRYVIKQSQIILFAGSFGGPAAILASRDSRVEKVVALSPVVDWAAQSKTEPLSKLERFVRQGFGEGYRFTHRDWLKLSSGRFYNPMAIRDQIDGRKLFLIHARDDETVDAVSVEKFAHSVGCRLLMVKHGGHFSLNGVMTPRFWPKIRAFLNRP